MDGDRRIEAFCVHCDEPTHHMVLEDDPGSCTCSSCGASQPLMVPIE